MDRRSFLKNTTVGALALFALPLSSPVPVLRTVEVYQQGYWVPVPWLDLKKGHIFRLRDPDGRLADNGEVCVAISDAERRPAPEHYMVAADPYTGTLG